MNIFLLAFSKPLLTHSSPNSTQTDRVAAELEIIYTEQQASIQTRIIIIITSHNIQPARDTAERERERAV